MPRGINNWTFREVTGFLKKRGFVLDRTRGSHHTFVYESLDGAVFTVVVPYHGRNHAIHPRTFKSIVTHSGIPLEDWLA
jgi:predicted RNA binding protein YcfA (HicA-like mRNA interferase family)